MQLFVHAGVIITAVDSFLLLLIDRLGVRHLEALFGVMVGIMAVAFGYMFADAGVNYGQVLEGMHMLLVPVEWHMLLLLVQYCMLVLVQCHMLLLVQSRMLLLAKYRVRVQCWMLLLVQCQCCCLCGVVCCCLCSGMCCC